MNGRTIRSKHRGRAEGPGAGKTRASDAGRSRGVDRKHRPRVEQRFNPGPYRADPIHPIRMPDFERMHAQMMEGTLIALRTQARQAGLRGYSKLNKSELARQIVQHQHSTRGNR